MKGRKNDSDFYVSWSQGIVRAIDFESGELLVITPIRDELVESVTGLLLGKLSIPTVLMLQGSQINIPYMSCNNIGKKGASMASTRNAPPRANINRW